MVAQKS